MLLPKIKLGSQVHGKSKFNLSHDANLTLNFGFVYPQTLIECTPKAETIIDINSIIRMYPLSVPTTSRLHYKTFVQYVPFEQIYEPFENLYGGKDYGTANAYYLPNKVPTFTSRNILATILKYAWCSVYYKRVVSAVTRYELITTTITTDTNPFKAYTNLFPQLDLYAEQWTPSFNPPFVLMTESDDSEIYGVDINGADFVIETEYLGTDYLFALRLNDIGKILRSIFIGLGYQFDYANGNEELNAMPLFAYYKAWFDLFMPQRYVSWTNTNCYILLDKIRSYNKTNFVVEYFREWCEFITDVVGCFYTDNLDYISAHIPTPSTQNNYTDFETSSPFDLQMRSTVDSDEGERPTLEVDSTYELDATSIKALLKLQSLQNISTAVGGKLKTLLKVLTGDGSLHNEESYHIGHSSMLIDITDVNNTTSFDNNTIGSSNFLGSYAGKGVGYNEKPHTFKYKNRGFGYIIVLCAIVPESNFFQGIGTHIHHVYKDDFYLGSIDSLGYEVTRQSVIMGDQSVSRKGTTHSNASFGFIPRMSSWKTHNSINNGDISLRSTRKDMLQYVLDKWISPIEITGDIDVDHVSFRNVKFDNPNIPIASIEWRFLNKYRWLANYDRIFPNGSLNAHIDKVNNTVHDDPFFAFNAVKVIQYANMKPIAESFETEGESGKTVEVQKS